MRAEVRTPDALATAPDFLSVEDMFNLPFDQAQNAPEPTSARESRRSRRVLQSRPRMFDSDAGLVGSGSPFRMSVFGMHSGRLFSTFTSRRSSSQSSAEALSYESMLALDENNPKRGVKKPVLDRLHSAVAGRVDVDKECHICMERFKRTTRLMHLPCTHRFCDHCIRQWLYNHRTCPLCRFQFSDKDTHFV